MVRVRVSLALLFTLLLPCFAFACPGDCNGDGRVTIEDLVIGVTILRGGNRVSACPSLDTDGGGVSIPEILVATDLALHGCPFLGAFYGTADLGGGQSGDLVMNVAADGSATGTLTLPSPVGFRSRGGGAAFGVSLTGSVNLATGEFSITGSYNNGSEVIPISISGTLPGPFGGGGSITFQIGPNTFGGSISPGTPPVPTATPTVTPTFSGKVHMVEVGGAHDSAFFPEFIAIDVGDTVVWNWLSGPHSVVSSAFDNQGLPSCDPDGAYDSGVRSSGSFSHTFTAPGDYNYHCGLAGHCAAFESAIIQVIGPSPTVTPTATRTIPLPTATATPATIDGVSIEMLGTFTGKAKAMSTGFEFDASIRIDAGSGSVTATDLGGTVFFFLGTLTMTVVDPTHLTYHQSGFPTVDLSLSLTSPGHIDGVMTVVNPGMPSTPVLLNLMKAP